MKNDCVRLSACVALTMLVLNYTGLGFALAVFLAALALSAAAAIFYKRSQRIRTALACLLCVCASACLFCSAEISVKLFATSLCAESGATVEGTLASVQRSDSGDSLILCDASVNGIKTRSRIRIKSPLKHSLDAGGRVTLRNAAVYSLGSDSQLRFYYYSERAFLGAYSLSDELTVKERKNAYYYLQKARDYVSNALAHNLPQDSAALADALLTGNKSDMSDKELYSFRYAGISHLIAVSGFHLTMWKLLTERLLDLLPKKRRGLSCAACITVCIAVMALAGFSKSVLRAGVMHILLELFKLFKQKIDVLGALFAATALILLVNPYAAASVSLQMSFLATFGIIAFSHGAQLPEGLLKKRRLPERLTLILRALYANIFISATASLTVVPVSALTLGSFTLLSPITTLICTLPSQIVMLTGAFIVIFSGAGFIAKPLSVVTALCCRFISFIAETFGKLEFAAVFTDGDIMRAVMTVFTVLFCLGCILALRNKRFIRRLVFLGTAFLTCVTAGWAAYTNANVQTSVIDVGDGLCCVFAKGGKSVVIGCGGSANGEYAVLEALSKSCSRNFELIILPGQTNRFARFYGVVENEFDAQALLAPASLTGMATKTDCAFYLDDCALTVGDDISIEFSAHEDASAARLSGGGVSVTVAFSGDIDWERLPESFKSGEILVACGSLPDISRCHFKHIIVSSRTELEGCLCTARDSTVVISSTPSGRTLVDRGR